MPTYLRTISLMKLMKRACGLSTVLEYSGWYCTPTYQSLAGTSTASTSPF